MVTLPSGWMRYTAHGIEALVCSETKPFRACVTEREKLGGPTITALLADTPPAVTVIVRLPWVVRVV